MLGPIEYDLEYAKRSFTRGNLAAAEIICRNVIDANPRDDRALYLLGLIAATIGMHRPASRYLSSALSANPANYHARDALNALTTNAENPFGLCTPKYLLIKSWGYGFWSDVAQVLGSLLLAEVTDRIPVVHWGRNSLFGDGSSANAFHNYFQPVSDVKLEDLTRLRHADYFPPKWTRDNLLEENVNKWQGNYSRAAALYFLARPEMIAVCDFYVGVIDVVSWLDADHPLHGQPLTKVYRYLIEKYLRPHQSIVQDCDSFYQAYLAGGPFIAFHARGSDKKIEVPELEKINLSNFAALRAVAADDKIFLLTDDESWVLRIRAAFGNRAVTTDCCRTSGTTGLHCLNLDDRVKLGREVMRDLYIALRADKFLGNGLSNVAAFIALMKDWNPGDCILGAPSQLLLRNLYIHLTPE